MMKLNKKKEIVLYLLLSILFAFTIQQLPFFKGNSLHLIHAIKDFDSNKLQNDWIANQTNHLPLFTFFNHFLIKFFSIKILYLVHFILLSICALFLFLICKNEFQELNKPYLSLIWFSLFTLIYHENSLFGGVAGQEVINEGYQPASYGVLFFIGIYLFLIKKNFSAVFFICLASSFHPTYVIHSGFLLFGISMYFIFRKEFKLLLKINTFYLILILPITFYIIYNFLLVDRSFVFEGQKILVNRAPHHALIQSWFSYKDIFSILIYLISLTIVLKKKRVFIPLLFFGLISIILTVIQFFTQNHSLALSFPWRSSVFLIPISTMIILSFLIQKISKYKIDPKNFAIILIIISITFFSLKNHLIVNSNQNFYKKIELTKKIKDNFVLIDRLLIPVDLLNIRMNSGLPIFVDWKHPPFKYNEIINWDKRMNLAKSFFGTNDLEKKKTILVEINNLEKVSHILIKKKKLNFKCENLIEDEEYALISVKNCF